MEAITELKPWEWEELRRWTWELFQLYRRASSGQNKANMSKLESEEEARRDEGCGVLSCIDAKAG